MSVKYRLRSVDHIRLAKLAVWLGVGPDLLLRKMVLKELDEAEDLQEAVAFAEDLGPKYTLAKSLELLEP